MRFQPKSEKEIQDERFPVLSPGKYHFEVLDAQEKVSKNGNPMIMVKLKILDQGFNVLGYVQDFLMEAIPYKLRHAAYVCGLGDHYELGALQANMFHGKTGVLELVIQKDKSGQYPDKNSVQDYGEKEKQPSHAQMAHEPYSWDHMQEPPPWVK